MRYLLATIVLAGCVYALMWRLHEQTFPEPNRPVAGRQEPLQRPVDPVTGVKLNWLTFLYRHTEDFQCASSPSSC